MMNEAESPGNEAPAPLSETQVESTGTPEAPSSPAEEALKKELEEARKAADNYKDQFLRKAAEFENYRRRTEADSANLVRYANEGLLLALLPIAEDFERSFKAENDHNDSFRTGIGLIRQKFTWTLEQLGVVPFESLGKPFDVGYHEALLQVARDDVPPGTVIEEVARGYMLHDRVLRHARVVVSSAVEREADKTTGESREAVQE